MSNFLPEDSFWKEYLEGSLCSKSQRNPDLPPQIDRLLDLPWTPEANRLIDLRLWHFELEFEEVR